MTLTVRIAPFGREAARVLRAEIDAAQGADPFGAVTVVVPRGAVGLASRRLLASGDLGTGPSGRPGIINVRFVTAAALSDELGGPALAGSGRRPATGAVVDAAVRSALAGGAGALLGPVRRHPATVRAVAAAYRDLRGVPAPTRRRLAAQSGRAAEVVRLIDAVEERLAGWYDETDLADSAAGVVLGAAGPAGGVDAYVWYLPLTPAPHVERLLGAIGRRSALSVVVGSSGRGAPDSAARALVGRLDPAAAPNPPGPGDPSEAAALPSLDRPTGTAVLSAPSADAEVLATLRSLMARNAEGVPLERMAVAYAGPPPYPRLVRELLDQAGIPSNGPGARALSATVAGRTLLGSFELAEGDWARDDVVSWLANAPVLAGGRPVPASAWDLVSREAGVLGGIGSWVSHLTTFTEQMRQRSEEGAADDDPALDGAGGWRRQLALGTGLLAFVTSLAARLADARRSWADWADWADALLEEYLGGPGRQTDWPAAEVEALTAVRESLRQLTVLDRIDPWPDAPTFRAALSAELEAAAPQTSRFGRGVLVGRVADMVGLDLDVLFVLGMNDGAFPAPAREDALLSDRERSAGGPEVPLRAVRVDDAERDYLAALMAAPVRVLSFARGGQSHARELRPSRWLLDTLGAVTGAPRRLYSGDLAGLAPCDGYRVLPSLTAAVRADGEPASVGDRDLRSLLAWREATGTLGGHYLVGTDPVLGAGVRARYERRTGRFTRFEGNVAVDGLDLSEAERPQSPTGLETYASCPRRYLFARVLRVQVRERPEDVLRMSPRDRGSMVHDVLERFVADQTTGPREQRIQPGTRWGPEGHERMAAEAGAVFTRYEQAGLVGRPLLWGFDRARILRDLHRFVEADDQYRRRLGVVPEEVELTFGRDGAPPVEVELSGGRRVRFNGRIDRVDRAADGSVVVVDYKTGSQYGMEELKVDPVVRGTRLQLVIYGLAARQRHGDVPVRSQYWFVSEKGGFDHVGYPLDPGLMGRFGEALEVVADGIGAGAFPARPGRFANGEYANCRFCDFKAACPGDRGRDWERLRGAPELARYAALAEPDDGMAS